MHTPGRRLTAIVFTDIVGYSAIVHHDEALGARLLDRQREVVRRIVPLHGGKEVETAGDSFLLEFGSALAAVEAVIAIQQELARQNESDAEKVVLRASVHLGDVEHRGDEVYGDGVNTAARLLPHSPEGGLALSAPVLSMVKQRIQLPVRSIGSPELKNIATPVEIFLLDAAELPALRTKDEPAARKAAIPKPPRKLVATVAAAAAIAALAVAGWQLIPRPARALDKSVAVLPFTNMSDEKGSQYFSDGMQDEILTNLARIRDIKVISRTSVERYRGRTHDLRTIAKELDVATVVEGAVQRVGDRVRINVQLIDAHTDAHLWAESYDRNLSDVFAVQSEIARKVADSLKATLLPQEAKALAAVPTQNNQAYDLYLRALALSRPLITHWDTAASLEAEQLLQQALQLDPGFALAAVALGDLRWDRWWFGPPNLMTDALMESVRSAGEQALALQPALGEAHATLARYYQVGPATGYAEGLRHAEQAIAALPNDAGAYRMRSAMLNRLGRLDDSLADMRRAVALDPQSFLANGVLWEALSTMGRFDEAQPYGERMLALNNALAVRIYAAEVEVWRNGELGPLRDVLGTLKPGSDDYRAYALAVFNLHRRSRDYAAAKALLEQLSGEWVSGWQNELPKALLMALLERDQGRIEAARPHFAQAVTVLQARHGDQLNSIRPQTAFFHYELARAYAGLGRRPEALATVQRMAELMPANDENHHIEQLNLRGQAEIHAMLGDADRAIALLRQMRASRGAGIASPGVLKLDPAWDPLRGDARFAALLKK